MSRDAIHSIPRSSPRVRFRSRGWSAWLLAGCLFAFASVAQAAEIVDLRVGRHAEFTRVVFELNAPTGYSLRRNTPAPGVSELVVTLDARGKSESIPMRKAMIENVDLVTGAKKSTAHIRLSRNGLRVKEMILANPPRIVLDVFVPQKAKAPVAKAPEPKKPAEATAKSPTTRVVKAPEPTKLPETSKPVEPPKQKTPAPEQVAKQTPAVPVVKPKAPEPQQKPKPETVAKAKLPDSDLDKTPSGDSPVASIDGGSIPPKAIERVPAQNLSANSRPGARPPTASPIARPSTGSRPNAAGKVSKPIPASTPPPPARRKPVPAPAQPAALPEPTGDSLFDMKTLGGGLALLGLVGAGAFVMVRRRSNKGEDMDLSDFDADPLAGDNPFADLGDQGMPDAGDSPIVTGADDMPVFGQPAPAQASADADAEDDLFNTTVVEDLTSTGTNDMPGAPASTPAAGENMESFNETTSVTEGMTNMPPAGAGGASPEMTQMMQQFEQRMASLEARIDEVSEAKERLERQVAAQTEELRVQRAAIARTQRALRNLNRPDDETPTEPALRNPSGPDAGV